MHIALLGSTGYVGSVFETQIRARGDQVSKIGRSNCELYAAGELEKRLSELSPDILINCAGYTGKPNVDACETDKTNCLAGNAVLPGIVAEACDTLEIPWGHVSSGCIFTGSRDDGGGFREEDGPNFTFRQNNCSYYSGTKALGEEILANVSNCYIWRLRIPFNHIDSPRNYITKLMSYDTLLQAENSLSHLDEFVSASLACFERNVEFGTYNLTNPGSVKTSDVVELIQQAGVCQKAFRFFDSESQFMTKAAKTPRSNCIMDSSKAIAAGLTLTPVQEALRAALEGWSVSEPVSANGK
ncbi:MAG: sugar nucleotide-binding protein [Planctomycetota bacterium]